MVRAGPQVEIEDGRRSAPRLESGCADSATGNVEILAIDAEEANRSFRSVGVFYCAARRTPCPSGQVYPIHLVGVRGRIFPDGPGKIGRDGERRWFKWRAIVTCGFAYEYGLNGASFHAREFNWRIKGGGVGSYPVTFSDSGGRVLAPPRLRLMTSVVQRSPGSRPAG